MEEGDGLVYRVSRRSHIGTDCLTLFLLWWVCFSGVLVLARKAMYCLNVLFVLLHVVVGVKCVCVSFI